jgi:murein DD-endopeptidase MepM/ murein hydrolase activator NlpD
MKVLYTGVITTLLLMAPLATAQNSNTPDVEVFKSSNQVTGSNESRSLRLSVTVEAPEFLQVEEGKRISKGQVIVDNKTERKRLLVQRRDIALQFNNLNKKQIPVPFEPNSTPPVLPVPPAQFLEEESNIAQAQLKLQQAESILSSRTPILLADNPEKRASMEKAEAALRGAQEKVREQEELLKSMLDMRLKAPIIRHEEAKLKQLQSETEQLQSALQREQALMAAASTEQQQELENLRISVQVARSDLQIANARLETARNNRKLVEYKASIELVQRAEEENRTKQVHSQQKLQYEENLRNKEYQLGQLRNQLGAVDEKLAQIPILRSPRDGYIRRIKPWVGNNGKYTTTITIAAGDDDNKTSTSNGSKPTSTQTTSGAKKQ